MLVIKLNNIMPFVFSSKIMFSQVKPTLAKLNEDADFDVRYFASEASVGMYLKFFKTS